MRKCFGRYNAANIDCETCFVDIDCMNEKQKPLVGSGALTAVCNTDTKPECFGTGGVSSNCAGGGQMPCSYYVSCLAETNKPEQVTEKPNCFGVSFRTISIECITCTDNNECLKKYQKTKSEPTPKTAPKNNKKEGKPRASLIPWDIVLEFICPAYEEGVIKYIRESWRDGFLISDLKDALDRHVTKFFYENEDYDPDAAELGIKKHHLAGAVFCLLAMLWTLKNTA